MKPSEAAKLRDTLCGLVWSDVDYDARPKASPRDDQKETATVVGEHRSKSVRLPVYSIDRPDLGIRFVLRENYYNWNVSVIAERPIRTDLLGFALDFSESKKRDHEKRPFHAGQYWDYCFFEGFPTDLMFGPFAMNARRFSLAISSDHALYAFVWMVMRDLRRERAGGCS